MKKCIKAIALAAVLVAMPLAAFAAGSKTYDDDSDSTSSSSITYGGGVSSEGTVTAGIGQVVSTTQQNVVETVTDSQVIVNADGSKVEVVQVTATSESVYTGLVKAESDSNVSLATGEAKTAGLPAETVAVIEAVDSGNLAAVPGVDTIGKTAYGVSAAVRAEEGNKLVTLYVSDLPAGSTAQILFYNNSTGTWTVISATVNPEGNRVTFIAPYSGTAIVIA